MKFLFVLLFPFQLFAQSPSILFKNVNIIDVEKGKVISNQHVLIEGNSIKTISSKSIIVKRATIINGSGKYLIPGLWDMHVHVFNNADHMSPNAWHFPLFIANGVTSVRDMWTKPQSMNDIQRWRKQLHQKPGTVPRFAAVGTLVDGSPAIYKESDSVTNATEARAMVRQVKAGGVDFFKVYSNLSREAYLAIADEAKKSNFPFAGHAPHSMTLEEVSNAGQRSVEHIGWFKLLIDFSSDAQNFRRLKENEWTPDLRKAVLQSFSKDSCRRIASIFAKNGTRFCATSVVLRASILRDDTSIIRDERLQYVPTNEIKNWMSVIEGFNKKTRPVRELRFQISLNMIKIMHDEGVQLLAGTDLGNSFIYPGSSVHDELEYFVAAGLSPLAALRTATINPAVFLNKQKELGTVTAGKLADLVLLDANPLTDINNIRKINAVVANGKLLQRKDLDNLLILAKKEQRK